MNFTTQHRNEGLFLSIPLKTRTVTPQMLAAVKDEWFVTSEALKVLAYVRGVYETGERPNGYSAALHFAEDRLTRYFIDECIERADIWTLDFNGSLLEVRKSALSYGLNRLKAEAYNNSADPLDVLIAIEEGTQRLRREIVELNNKNLHQEFEEFLSGTTGRPIPTGISVYDDHMLSGGFFPGNLVFIGGEPGTGKTSLCLTAALYQASNGIPVSIYTFEQRRIELRTRLVANITGIPGVRIAAKKLSRDEDEQARAASKRIENMPLSIIDVSTVPNLPSLVTSMRLSDSSIVYVDSLNTIPMPARKYNPGATANTTEKCQALQAACKATGKPVIVCAHLNREARKQEATTQDGRLIPPQKTDFRDSSEVEYSSDGLYILQHADPNDMGDKTAVYIWCVKNRNGKERQMGKLAFNQPVFRYERYGDGIPAEVRNPKPPVEQTTAPF